MAASGPRERRAAIWPYLVMPIVVLAAFYVLKRVREHPGPEVLAPPPPAVPATPAPVQ
jgi:hypothetical protein